MAVVLLALLTFIPGWGAAAWVREPAPAELEAEFIFNLLKFVQWPAHSFGHTSSPFVIGTVCADSVAAHLERFASGRTVLGRGIVVLRIQTDSELHLCHLVFFGVSHKERVNESLRQIRHENILTVGEGKGFSPAGGMIDLTVNRGRVRFAMNPAAASRSRLHISSKLFRMATIVRDHTQGRP